MTTQPLYDSYERGQEPTVTLTRAQLREIRREAFEAAREYVGHQTQRDRKYPDFESWLKETEKK